MKIEARRDDRGYALIANFEDGFALGWKMAVPESFKEALDIKLTSRKFAGKTEMLWTQGRIYDFHEGDTLYDKKEAYQEWGKALKKLTLCVQVQYAESSSYITYETIETNHKEIEVIHQKGKSKLTEKIIDGLEVKKQRIDHGLVRFKVYRPNEEKNALEERDLIECTQDDFIAFLQTGIVRTQENKQLNLFAKNA